MSNKYVYLFSEADASMKNLLGGKGSNLAEMTNFASPFPWLYRYDRSLHKVPQ